MSFRVTALPEKITGLLFIHTLFNWEQFTKVHAVSSLRTSPHPSHFWHDLLGAKSLLSEIVGKFLTEGNYLESAGLKLRILTFLLQTQSSARGERLTDWAIKTVNIFRWVRCWYMSIEIANLSQCILTYISNLFLRFQTDCEDSIYWIVWYIIKYI